MTRFLVLVSLTFLAGGFAPRASSTVNSLLPVAAEPPVGPLGGELPTGPYKSSDATFTPGGVLTAQPFLRMNIDDPFPADLLAPAVRWLLPVPGYITSPFGKVRLLPIYKRKMVKVKRKGKIVKKYRRVRVGRRRHVHRGIDLKAYTGDDVKAVAGGVVSYAGRAQGYGRCVYIQHPDGLETRYAHASRLKVQTGDTIAAGDVIAQAGCTGRCSGPHLHFEVRRDGETLNPLPFLEAARIHEEESGEGDEGEDPTPFDESEEPVAGPSTSFQQP